MARAYIGAMPIFPRPVAPKSAIADLREMFAPERPHRWPILILSIVLTSLLLWGFALDSRIPPKPREIFYVESWTADRKDSVIIEQQIKDVARFETIFEGKQEEFQRLADRLGIEWREDAMRNKIERAEIIASIKQTLKERLAAALEREALAADINAVKARGNASAAR